MDTSDKDGWTPLHVAAYNGHVSVIELLVRLGSRAIDTPDNHGWTPMYAAAFKERVSVLEALVRLGSNAIDLPHSVGSTPWQVMLRFSECQKPECLKLTVMLGAGSAQAMAQHQQHLLDQDEVSEVRYRVYFARSLVYRLLFG